MKKVIAEQASCGEDRVREVVLGAMIDCRFGPPVSFLFPSYFPLTSLLLPSCFPQEGPAMAEAAAGGVHPGPRRVPRVDRPGPPPNSGRAGPTAQAPHTGQNTKTFSFKLSP